MTRPEEEFNKACKSTGGKLFRKPMCKLCEAEIMRDLRRLKKEHPTPDVGAPCECCGKTSEKLMLDHDHDSGRMRGFLCRRCNIGLGMMRDSLIGVRAALKYMNRVAGEEDGESDDEPPQIPPPYPREDHRRNLDD